MFFKSKNYFLTAICISVWIASCASTTANLPPLAPQMGLSILQGYTSDNSSQINVVVPKNHEVRYSVRTESTETEHEIKTFSVKRSTRDFSNYAVDNLNIKNLQPGIIYLLEVRDSNGGTIDTREFHTLNTSTTKLRFVAASCMDSHLNEEQQVMWRAVFAKEPDLLFLIGDNVYATKNKPLIGDVTPEILWDTYIESRQTLDLYRTNKLVPTLAIWDDNDYGEKDGSKSYKFRKESAEILRTFFPQAPDQKNLWAGPGISHLLSAFNMNFALMDDRYFRDLNESQSPQARHWGQEQEDWLFKHLRANKNPIWLFNGNQIFGGFHEFESFEGNQPENFKRVINKLAKLKRPVAFVTGDRHLYEFLKIDEPTIPLKTFEITTSPLHARPAKTSIDQLPTPRRLDGATGENNFAFIEAITSNKGLMATVTIHGAQNKVLMNRFISISSDGKNLTTY